MTIEDRAYEAVGHPKRGGMHTADMMKVEERTFVNGYIKGAQEQQKIDIEKACDWIRDNMSHFWHTDKKDEEYLIKQFKKAMEE